MSAQSSPGGPLAVGQEIMGMHVVRLLGTGPHGWVYEVTQPSLDRRAALKLLRADLTADERFRARFTRAAQLQASLEHPHVMPVFKAGESRLGLFVAMELVRGTTLDQPAADDALDCRSAVRLLGQIAGAIDAAHAIGLEHGDVKPENVLIGEDGHAYLTDFGLASTHETPDREAFAVLARDLLAGRGCGEGAEAIAALGSAASLADQLELALAPRSAPQRFGRGRRYLVAAAGLTALVTGATVLLSSGGSEQREDSVRARPAAGLTLGSDLEGGRLRTVACPVLQTQCMISPGRPMTARRDGVITNWAVRGGGGETVLVVSRRARGRLAIVVARSDPVFVPGPGVHGFPANIPIHRGDFVEIELAPGARIGLRPSSRGDVTAGFGLTRSPRATRLAGELLLRVEY